MANYSLDLCPARHTKYENLPQQKQVHCRRDQGSSNEQSSSMHIQDIGSSPGMSLEGLVI